MPFCEFDSLKNLPRSQRWAELRRIAGIRRAVTAAERRARKARVAEDARREALGPEVASAYLAGTFILDLRRQYGLPSDVVKGMLDRYLTPEQRRQVRRESGNRRERNRQRRIKGITPDRYKPGKVPVTLDGVKYESIRAAADAQGLRYTTLHHRLQRAEQRRTA